MIEEFCKEITNTYDTNILDNQSQKNTPPRHALDADHSMMLDHQKFISVLIAI
jgi:hypothetical protein